LKINMDLAARITVGLAVTMLFGASAFADSRHSNETRARSERGSGDHNIERREQASERRGNSSANSARTPRATDQSHSRQGDGSIRRDDRATQPRPAAAQNRTGASGQRPAAQNGNRSTTSNRTAPASGGRIDVHGRRPAETRNDDRYRNSGRGQAQPGRPEVRDNRRHDNRRDGGRVHAPSHARPQVHRQPYYAHGRVSRYEPYRGGYRVWIVGAPYPFFVPEAYYRANRLRVGVSIRLGGYYNPLGYYDYYDGRAYSHGVLRGWVESVDYRRDTFVMRNEATGSFVTVLMRRGRDVRPGDYVEVTGDWARSGLFDARYVDLLDYGYRR
jgi:hypothetical protein